MLGRRLGLADGALDLAVTLVEKHSRDNGQSEKSDQRAPQLMHRSGCAWAKPHMSHFGMVRYQQKHLEAAECKPQAPPADQRSSLMISA
jgi:hypothetical protein